MFKLIYLSFLFYIAYDLPSPEGAAAIAYLKSGRDDLPELVTDYTAGQYEHTHNYQPETYVESMPCVSGGSQVNKNFICIFYVVVVYIQEKQLFEILCIVFS